MDRYGLGIPTFRGEGDAEALKYSYLTTCSTQSPNPNPNPKFASRPMSEEERNDEGNNLDVGLWSALHDDLLEKIIASLPFKSFVRASTSLSKTWRLKVHSPLFRRELNNSSSSWESYCPVYFMNRCKDVVGYGSSSKLWHRLPTHPNLQSDGTWVVRAGAGPLICCTRKFTHYYSHVEHVYVMNSLTQSWKQLPLRPDMSFPEIVHIDLEGTTAYKVILGTVTPSRLPGVDICVQIFDSTDSSWTIVNDLHTQAKFFVVDPSSTKSTLMNGVLYLLTGPYFGKEFVFTLISLDVKKKVWSETPLQLKRISHDALRTFIVEAMIVASGSHLIMTIYYKLKDNVRTVPSLDHESNTHYGFCVFQLVIELGLAFEVSKAPKDLLDLSGFFRAVAHDDCLYITTTILTRTLVVYNVGTRQWHKISGPSKIYPSGAITCISYRPGLNPLLEL